MFSISCYVHNLLASRSPSEPAIQQAADAGGGVRRVVMVRLLGVVEDFVDVFRVGTPEKDDIRPPFAQVAGDLDELVLMLGIFPRPPLTGKDFLFEKALITVVFAVEGIAHEAIRLREDLIQHLIHVLMPETAVEIDLSLPPAATGEGGAVTAAIGGIYMGETVPEERSVLGEDGIGLKDGLLGSDME